MMAGLLFIWVKILIYSGVWLQNTRNPGGYLYTNNKIVRHQIGNKVLRMHVLIGSVSGISIGDYSQSRALGIGFSRAIMLEIWTNPGYLLLSVLQGKGFAQRLWCVEAYTGEQYAAAIGTAASAQGKNQRLWVIPHWQRVINLLLSVLQINNS